MQIKAVYYIFILQKCIVKKCKKMQSFVMNIRQYVLASNHHHYISFNLFSLFAWVGWFFMDFETLLSFTRSLLTFFCFRSFLITPFHVFWGLLLGKVPLSLKVLYLLDKTLSCISSRWPNHLFFYPVNIPSYYKFLIRNPSPLN